MIELPSRLSQTLLARHDACPHSAWLGIKHRGTRGHELARGIAYHLFEERAFRLLIEQGEPSLPPEVAKQLMNEALDETPGVTVADADKMRECAYHFAVGCDVDVNQIAAIEQTFALELGGWQVVGRLDLAGYFDATSAWIDDAKTQWNLPDQAQIEAQLQLRLYGVLLAFGRPVQITDDGIVDDGPALGHGVETVRLREVYPRFLGDDNLMRSRHFWVTRGQLEDWRVDLERRVREVDAALKATELAQQPVVWVQSVDPADIMVGPGALLPMGAPLEVEPWKPEEAWPAIHGSHCTRCPARGECPLDKSIRSWAGEVNDAEQAAEAATWADRMSDRVKATNAELKAFASSHGPISYGADYVREFAAQDTQQTDWSGLEDGIVRATSYGEPFELAVYRKTRTSTRFVRSKRGAA